MALIYAILAPASRPSTYGRNTGLVNMGAAIIAVTLGPVVITQLVGVTTWQVAFLLAAIPSAIIGFVMIALIKETYNPPETVSGKKQNTFVEALKYRNVLMCCLIGIAGFGGYWIMMLYAPVYWTNAAGIDIQSMGFVASGMGVLAVVYSFLIPKLSDNLGRKSVLIVVYFLAFLAPLVLSTMVGTKLSIGVYLLFAGLPCAVLPLFMSIIPVESTPPELRATAGGLVIGIGEVIGGAIVPAVAGNIGDAYGLTATMLIGAACLLIAAILGFFLKETNIVVLQKREKKNAA